MIQLAAGLKGPPPAPWCKILQLRSCSAMPGSNVRVMSGQVVHLVRSTLRFGIRTVKRRAWTQGADPAITGPATLSTAFEAAGACWSTVFISSQIA